VEGVWRERPDIAASGGFRDGSARGGDDPPLVQQLTSAFRVSAALDADLARRPPRIGFGLSIVGAANDLRADHPQKPGTRL